MAKAALTLDEINLLKNSEEPKDIKLYGNLYEILCQWESTGVRYSKIFVNFINFL